MFIYCFVVVYPLFGAENAANANFFRELGGVVAVTDLLPFGSTRPLALRLLTHLILSEGKLPLLVPLNVSLSQYLPLISYYLIMWWDSSLYAINLFNQGT